MIKKILAFLNRPHKHYHDKPIASMYISFSTRDIIYECKCGHRQIYRQYFGFDDPLPIPTNSLITYKEFFAMLDCPANRDIPKSDFQVAIEKM